jgi:ABC-2 type transport system permease protein
LAEDIRLGRISAFLVYPFGFWQFHGASFLAFQVGQTLITLVTISSLSLLGMITPSLGDLFLGFYFCFLVSLIWFSMQFLLGVIAFWLEETWVLRVMFVIVCQFLSGAIIPLEIYPQWLTKAMGFSPFPYLTFVPVKILMGTYKASLFPVFGLSPLMQASVILIFWLLVIHITGLLIWRRGIRLYTAAGM